MGGNRAGSTGPLVKRWRGEFVPDGASLVFSRKGFFERLWYSVEPESPGVTFPLRVTMVGHSRWDREGFIKRNNYQGFGIELIVRGNAVFIQDGKEFLVNAPGAFCKLPGSNHEYRTGPAGFLLKRFMAMQIPSFDRLAALMDFPADTPITVRDINRISGYFKEAVRLMTRKDRDVSIELAGIGFQVLLALSSNASAVRYPPWLASVLDLMKHSLHRSLSIEEMTDRASMSTSHFYRLFEAETGVSPSVYFRTLKMKHAEELLRHTSYSIKQIAHLLGYANPFHFSHCFKEHAALSPRAWRKKP